VRNCFEIGCATVQINVANLACKKVYMFYGLHVKEAYVYMLVKLVF
jgi:hypothetical protein